MSPLWVCQRSLPRACVPHHHLPAPSSHKARQPLRSHANRLWVPGLVLQERPSGWRVLTALSKERILNLLPTFLRHRSIVGGIVLVLVLVGRAVALACRLKSQGLGEDSQGFGEGVMRG